MNTALKTYENALSEMQTFLQQNAIKIQFFHEKKKKNNLSKPFCLPGEKTASESVEQQFFLFFFVLFMIFLCSEEDESQIIKSA